MKIKRYIKFAAVLFLSACATGEKAVDSNKTVFNFQLGMNKGGITDNVDFKEMPSVEADAYSGATNIGFNAGAHVQKPILRNSVETGLDFMYNTQTFTYKDLNNGYTGERKVGVSQFMVPLTYNFGFFKKTNPLGKLQIRAGWNFQFNFFSFSGETGVVPVYSTKSFSQGFTIGLTYLPIQTSKGQLGFFVDGYRGSKIYNDFYNQDLFEMPASSYMKFGVLFRLK